MASSTPTRAASRGLAFALHPVSLAVCLLGATPLATALPQGAVPTVGQAAAKVVAPGQMQIVQSTPRAGLDWTSFSIAAGESVKVLQPARSSVLLNRVVGEDASQIYGSLSSNGSVWLINPRGIVFGPNSRVDVGSLVASTLSISQGDLASGRLQLGQGAGAGELRAEGSITATDGTVALVAPQLTQSGSIEARRVGLAAAGDVLVDVEGDGLVFFNVRSAGLPTRLAQLGQVRADGGSIELRAAARAGLAETVLNVDGLVQARSMGLRGGRIVIDGGDEGITRIASTLDATGADPASRGGDVLVQGQRILLDQQAVLDASGSAGGGQVRVGGDFQGRNPEVRHADMVSVTPGARLAANALLQGDGGRVIVWSDQATRFAGQADARGGAQGGDGGLVEVSSKGYLGFTGQSDRSAAMGRAGTLLLDPTNLTIQASSPDINDDGTNLDLGSGNIDFADPGTNSRITSGAVVTQLVDGPVTLQATGNISVTDAINSGSANDLRLSAGENIVISQPITVGGNLHLSAHDAGSPGGGTGRVQSTATLSAGGSLTLDNGGGTGVHSIGANLTANSLAVTGGLDLTSDVTLSLSSGVPLTLAADISGVGGLTKSGSASLELTGTHTYTGNTTVTQGALTLSSAVASTAINVSGGSLALSATNLLPDSAVVAVTNNASVTLAASETVATLNLAGTLAGAGTLTVSGTSTLTGANVDGALVTGLLTQASGSSTLRSAVTVGTATAIDGGTLTVGNGAAAGSLATGTLALNTGATLAFARDTQVDLAVPVAGTGGTLRNDGSGGLLISDVAGAVTAVEVTAGTLTLAVGNTDRINNLAAVTLSNGASMSLAADETVDTLNLAGTLAGAGKLIVSGTSTLTGANVNAALDTGLLTQAGGNSTLRAAVTVGTASSVDGGTLTVGNGAAAGSLATGTLALNTGATLAFARDTQVDLTIPVGGTGGTLRNSGSGGLLLSNVAGSVTAVEVTAGTLTLADGSANRINDNAAVTVSNNTVFALGDLNETVRSFDLTGTLGGNTTSTLTATDSSTLRGTTLNPSVVNAALAGGPLTVLGDTTLNNGASAGTVNINAGTLTLAAGGALDSAAAVTVEQGAGLSLSGNQTVGAFTLAGTLSGGANRLILAGTATLQDLALVNAEIDSGTIASSGSVVVNRALAATAINVNSGELTLGAANLVANNASINVATSSTLTANGNDNVGALTLAGTLGGTGTLTASGLQANGIGATVAASLALAGPGNATVADGGRLTVATGGDISFGSGAYSLGSGSELAFTRSGNFALGDVTGTGAIAATLRHGGSGILTFTGAAANVGTINVNGGGTLAHNGTAANLATLAVSGNSSVVLGDGPVDRLSNGANVSVATGSSLVTGDTGETIGTLSLGGALSGASTLTAGSYTLQAGSTVDTTLGTGTLTVTGAAALNQAAAATTVQVDNGGSLTMAATGSLDAAANVTVATGGTLTLGANDTVNTLALGGALNGGGLLLTATNGITLSSGAVAGANLGAGTLTVSGSASLVGTSAATTVLVQNGGTLGMSTALRLTGLPALTVASGGTMTMNGDEFVNTFSGSGTVNGTGVLHTNSVTLNNSSLGVALSTGTMQSDGASSILGDLEVTTSALVNSGELTVGNGATGALTMLAGSTLTVNPSATLSYQRNSSVTLGNVLGTGTLRQRGSGELHLTGTVASATVLVDNGSLVLDSGSTNRLADNAQVTVSGGALLRLDDASETVGALTMEGTLAAGGVLTASTATLRGGAAVNAGLVATTSALVSGAATLNAALATPTLQINATGNLTAATGTLGAGSDVSVTSGGTLALAGSQTVQSLALAGTLNGPGTLNATNGTTLNESAQVNAPLGAGTLTVTGNSTLAATAATTTVNINTGTLTLDAGDLLADGATVTVQGGAGLVLGGNDTITALVSAGTVSGATHTLQAGSYTLQGGADISANLGTGTLSVGGNARLSGTAGTSTVQVSGGVFTLVGDERLSNTAAVTVDSGRSLELGGTETVASLALAGTLAGTGTLVAAQYTLDGGNTLATAQLGAGTLTSQGNSTLRGTAAAGTVQVSSGTLTLNSAERLADNAAVTVDLNATLTLSDTETVGSLTLAGTLGGGNRTLNASSIELQTNALVTANLGAGALVVTGTAQLDGSTQATSVDVQAGASLSLGAAQRLAAQPALQLDGQLTLGGNETVGALQGSGTAALASHTLGTNANTDTVFSGSTTGTGNLSKLGTGALGLTGTLGHTGLTTVAGGTVVLASTERLHNSSRLSVASGAILQLGGTETVAELTLAGTLAGTGTVVAAQYTLDGGDTLATAQLGAGTLTSQGNSTLRGTSAAGTVQVSSGTLTLGSAGRLAAAAQVSVGNSATLLLGGDENVTSLTLTGALDGSATLTAPSYVFSGGTANANLGTGDITVSAGGTLAGTAQAGTVAVNLGSFTLAGVNRLANLPALNVGANGTVVLGGDQTLGTLAGDGALALGTHTLSTGLSGDSSFAGVISGSSGGLVKQGAGSFTLAGNNSYGGSTRLAAGTLLLGADNVLPNGSAVQVDSGTTLALGGSDTVSTLVLDGTLAGAGTLTASSYTLHSGTVAAGAALGAGALSSSGTSALAGTAAATTVGVADGTLLLDGVNRLNGNPDITVASGATLQLTGAQSASTLGLSGTLTGSGHTLTATTTTLNTGAVVGANLGGGTLQVAGNATLTGTAGSGTVNVAGGDLVLSSAGRLAATADVTVSSSRTLTLGGDEIVDTLTLGGTLAGSGHMLTAGTTTLQTDAVVDANLGGGTLLVSGNARLSGTAGSGTVTVLGGELTLSSPGRLAAGADVTVQAGGALTLAGNETVSLFTSAGTLGGSGTLTASSYVLGGGTVNANLGTGTLSVTGDSFLAGTSLATFVNLDSGTLTLAGAERLADGAALALLGPARLTLGGDETVASLNSAGQINGSGSVRAASYTLTGGVVDAGLGAGALSVDGSTVINGQIETGSVDLISGTLTLGSVGRLAVQPELLVRSAATLRLGGAETVSSLAGAGAVDLQSHTLATLAVSDTSYTGVMSGSGGLVKAGTGVFTLGGDNSYTGSTQVQGGTLAVPGTLQSAALQVTAGTLALGAADRLADTATVTVAAGAAMTLAGNDTVAALDLAGSLGGSGTLSALTYALIDATVSANLGAGALTSSGASTLHGTSAADTLAVDGGSLTLAAAERLVGPAAVAVAGGATLVLGADQRIGSLAGAGAVDLSSHTLTTGSLGSTTFSGAIGGTGGLVKQGGGSTFTLSGDNSYTGATRIEGGVLALPGTLASGALQVDGGTLALGAADRLANTATLSVASGAQATLAGDETVAALTLGGTLGGSGTLTAATYTLNGGTADANLGTGTLTSNQSSQLNGTAAATTVLVNGTSLTLGSANRLAAGAAVTVASGATLNTAGDNSVNALTLAGTLAGTGTFNASSTTFEGGTANANLGGGTITVNNGGTLAGTSQASTVAVNTGSFILSSADRLGMQPAVDVGATAHLQLGGAQTLGSLSGSGTVDLSTHTLSTGVGGDSSFAGVISGSGGIVKQGASSFTLSGANTYTGATTVSTGALVLGAADVLDDASAVTVASGATLALGGADTVATLALAGTVAGSGTLTAASYALDSGTVAAGAALGAGSLTSSGTSTLAGTAAAGTVSVTGGTLLLDGVNRLNGNPDITVASGATLQLAGAQGASTLALTGTLAGSGHTLTAGTTTLNTGAAVDANLGTGTLQVAGNATLTGTAGSDTVNVAGGNLSLASAGRLAAGADVTVSDTRTLTLGGDETVDTFTLAGTLAGVGHRLTASQYTLQTNALVLANLGLGTLTVTGNSSLSGDAQARTVQVNAGLLTLNSGDRLSDLANVTVAAGAALTLNADDTVLSLSSAGTINGPGTLFAGAYSLTGGIYNADIGGGALTATGTNLLNGQSAASTVDVINGVLTLGSAGRFTAQPEVMVRDTATLRLGGAETFKSLAGGGAVDLQSHTLTSLAVADTSYTGVMSGTGGLVMSGPAVFTLGGNNTYTGSTLVQSGTLAVQGTLQTAAVQVTGGTLALGAADRLLNTATVSVGSTATLTLAGDDTVASLALAGTLGGTGTLTAATYALNAGTVNANLGAGALTSLGASTLNGTSAAGTLAVNGGSLTLAAANRLVGPAAVTVAGGASVVLGANQGIGSLAGAGAVDLASFTLSTGALGSTSYSGAMGGTGGLVKQGASSFTLSGANTYTGSTRIEAGTLALSGTLASGAVFVDAGTLSLAAAERLANTATLSVASGAQATLTGDETVAALALAGTLGGSGTLTAATYALDGGTVNANLGTGALQSLGSSTLNGTAAAGTVAINGGTLTLSAANRLTALPALSIATGASLQLGGNHTLGSLSGSGTVGLSTHTLSTGVGGDSSYGGVISGAAGSGGLVKQGGSTFTLAGSNTFSGSTRVQAGTLAAAVADVLPDSSAVTVDSGATLRINGNDSVATLALAGTLAGTGTLSAASYAMDNGTAIANLGAGTLVSNGDSSLNGSSGAGTVAVNTGRLGLGSADRLADAAQVTVATGATLRLNGSDTVSQLNLAGTLEGTGTLTAASYALAGGTANLDLGTGTLSSTGASRINNLTAASSVAVDGGTLTLGAAQRSTALPAVTVANGATLTLGGDEVLGTLSGAGTVGLQAFTLRSGLGGDSTFAGVMAGSGGFVKQGSGSFTLSGANTYTGITLVDAGTLAVQGTLASTTVNVNAGTLALAAANRLADTAAVQVAIGARATLAGDDTVATLALQGTLGGSGTLTAASYTLAGGTATANLGAGTLASSGDSTISGTAAAGTVAVNGGTLTLTAVDRLVAVPAVTVAGGATLQLGAAQTIGTLSGAGTVALDSFALSTGSLGDSRFDGVLAGSGDVVKQGNSSFTLAGASTYTGSTQVDAGTLELTGTLASQAVQLNAGTLALGSANRLADNAAISVANGARLTLAGDDTVATLALAGTLGGSGTLSATTYALQSGTVDAQLGAGALRTAGNSVLNGTAAAGTVAVDSGTLTLSATNRLVAGPAVDVASGATLALGASQVIGSLAGGGTVQLSGSTLSTGDLGSSNFAGVLADNLGGAGALVKTGSSSFTLSGNSSYTGNTLVQGGTLAVAGTLQSAALTVQAGTLALAAGDRLADGAALSVARGASLTLAGNDTVSTLALAGTLGGSGTLTASSVALDGGTVLANLGTGAVTSVGTSTLSGTSAASTVAVQGGVLTLSSGQRLSALPAVTLDTGATLQLAGDQTLGTLAGSGTLALAGFTATTGALGSSSFGGVVSGSGGLVKTGTSSFTLTGANSYSGHTRIEGGTLAVTGTLASSTLDVAAGTLALAAPDRLLDSAAVQVQSGAFFTLAGNDTIASLLLRGTLAGTGTLTAASVTLQDGTANLDLGTGALVSRGASTMTGHTAASTLAVESGLLTLGSAGRFTAAPAVAVASGAELLLGGAETLGSLSGAGTLALQGFTLSTGVGSDSSFAGVVSGSGGITKQGSSRFTLAGANTYTGATQVDAGTLAVSGTQQSATATVGAGATLALTAADRLADTSEMQVLTGGTLTLAGDDSVANVAIAGTLGGSGRLTAATYTLDSGTVQADLGSGTLSSTGGSTLGGTSQAATVNVQTGTLALGSANRLIDSAAVAVASGATLRLNGDDGVATLALSGTLDGTGTLSASTTTLSSGTVIANLGAGALVSTGSSTLGGTSAASTVAVDSGTLALGAAQRLTAQPALTVAGGATLQLGGDQSLGTLAGAGNVNLGAATLSTGSGGDSLYAGQVAGSGGLVKQGESRFTLTGSNSYTGNTTVAQGTLRVGDGGNTGSLATAGLQVQGALVFERNDAVTLAQPVSGSGTLTQAGSGTLTLAGNNKTYTGDTNVANGVLATADGQNLPDTSAVLVQAGGHLSLGGSEILRSVTAQGTVALAGDVTASEDLLLSGAVTVPGNQGLKLTARRIDAVSPGNIWGQSVSLDASERVTLASGTDSTGGGTPTPRNLVLGTVTLAAGGRIDAGTLSLNDTTTLSGGTLELVSSAAQAITAPGADLADKQAFALPIAYAADAVQQTGGSIELAAGAGLQVHAVNGGSISLTRPDNRFLGSLQILSGAAFGTGWVPNATPGEFGVPAPKGYALQNRVQVAGSTVVLGGQGIEADVISISADMLTTPTVNNVVPTLTARLPFDNTLGTEVSLPGLTLALTERSFELTAPFGASNGGELRINVGSRLLGNRTLPLNAGYVTVLPRGQARGSTAVLLAGPAVDSAGYRFFFDGAGVEGEIPVFYNGLTPVTPAVESSISATVSVSEGARKERFDEAIRTENVAVRLRAGVIAEVGPGRPATQGSEGARGPASCAPAVSKLACETTP